MENNPSQSTAPTVIGFLGYREFEEGEAYRGAILVTDGFSKPLEFRCTAPVRPTHLQRTLYGKSLLPHILTELIGAPLIESVREKPQLILITDDEYFDVRQKVVVPVLRVRRQRDNTRSDETKKSKRITLQSASGKFDQLELEAHWNFPADLDATGERYRDLFGRWDLAEPFVRLTEGLQFVHDERVLEA